MTDDGWLPFGTAQLQWSCGLMRRTQGRSRYANLMTEDLKAVHERISLLAH
jgi:hypothetical protein